MKIIEHEDAVAIYIDGLADIEPARQIAERALIEKRCRVSALCMTLDMFGRGSYLLAATITPNLAVRSAQGYETHLLHDLRQTVLAHRPQQITRETRLIR